MIGVKLFKEQEYAKQFMKGQIYISAAGRFSKATDAQRRYTEGMIPIFDKSLVIDGQVFNVPYSFSYHELDRVPVFCFTILDERNSTIVNKTLNYDIPKGNHELGKHLVLFDVDEFYRILSPKVTACGCGIIGKKVKYFDFNNLKDNSWHNEIKTPYDCLFLHDIKHKNQNEFRFVLTEKIFDSGFESTIVDVGEWDKKPRYMEIE